MSETITTDELLDTAEERTGLQRGQLLMMVAKSAAVRHVAGVAEGGDRFVLKGGTLLTHVYRSPRQSIGDADYLHLDSSIETDQVERALDFTEGDFTMEASMRYDDARAQFEGKGVFSFEQILVRRQRDRELKITVSIRKGERLDPPEGPLFYTDRALAGENTFAVQGLTINELSAEKILGWCSKDLVKHVIDLAYVARERQGDVDHDRVAELIKEKFAAEGGSARYRRLGITSTSDLLKRFAHAGRLESHLHQDWGRLCADEIFFLEGEQAEPADRQLLDPGNVERLALEFWAPTLDRL